MRPFVSDRQGPTQRQLKVGEEVRHLLSDILRKIDFHPHAALSATSLTISEVRMSPDLRQARVYVLTLQGKDIDAAVSALNEQAVKIRQLLAKKLVIKFMPRLQFFPDHAFFEAEKIEALFQLPQVKKDIQKE
jgi:ribosome-binding factor A